MTNSTILILVLVFAAVWAVQMAAGGWQARRFMRAVRAVRIQGRTAIGVAGGRVRGRAYVAIAVGPDDRVVAATRLTGKTVLAAPQDLPQIVGHDINDLASAASGPLGDTTIGAAAADAARHLQKDNAETGPVEASYPTMHRLHRSRWGGEP